MIFLLWIRSQFPGNISIEFFRNVMLSQTGYAVFGTVASASYAAFFVSG